jgi:four helix bundle protein
MQDFKQLKVWQKSHTMVLRIYAATAVFPEHERFGITSQMRRAAASVPANIAEGCARAGRAEFCQFLHVSAGSASELEYFLLLARDLRLFTDKQHAALHASLLEIRRMLTGLIQQVDPRRAASNAIRAKSESRQPIHPVPPVQTPRAKNLELKT